ncbi:MAG: hypothetical protein II802_04100 [Clostridia bacterium]|nr:hypothetical protein [Clostridia bacterium]
MKQIFAGEVYEILPTANGFVFAYCKEKKDDNVTVAFKMLTFDGQFTDVAKNIYLLSKFGNNYKAVSSNCKNFITVKSLLLPNGKVFLLEDDGSACLLDVDASLLWSGELTYRNNAPSDIKIHHRSLWACYKESDVLLKFSLNTMREELRIGGKSSPFKEPRDIFIDGDNAIISNSGSNKLIQFNLKSYNFFEVESFEESVWQYIKVNDYRIVVLKSGIYLI